MSNIPNSPQKHYGDAISSSNAGGAAGETDGGDAAATASGASSSSARKNCGTHGSMSYREFFGTVSPEKDGTVDTFWLNDMEYGTIMDYHHGPTGEGSVVRPMGNDTMLYRLSTGDGGMLSTWTDVLTANHRLEGSGTRIVAYDDNNNDNGRTDTTHILSNATRSVFEDGWTKDLLRAMHVRAGRATGACLDSTNVRPTRISVFSARTRRATQPLPRIRNQWQEFVLQRS